MKKLITVVITAALLLSGCSSVSHELPLEENLSAAETVFEAKTSSDTVTTVSAETVSTEKTATEKPVPEFATVSVVAVGDNLIHSSIYKQAAARDGNGGYDFGYAYKNVEGLIRRADMAIINQETLICNDLFEPSTYPRFNSPAALGDHMLDIGFDVFTIANNHTLDKDEA